MKCILLCAGYATRMYPLTENFPKPLLDIKGKDIPIMLVVNKCIEKIFSDQEFRQIVIDEVEAENEASEVMEGNEE